MEDRIEQANEYDEIVKQKRAKRAALMSEKEIEEAEQFLIWYRRAYEDKQRLGLMKKWDDIAKYWEGDFDYSDEDDPAPNTNITNANIEGKTALLCDQSLAIQVDPREPGDKPFCEQVRTIADFIKDKNKMYRKIEVHERRREMTGTGIFRVLWDFDKLEGKGLPIIEPIHPSKLFIDTAITDVYDIQEAQYIIEAKAKSIYNAKMEYEEELADCIIANYDPIENLIQNSEEEQYVHLLVWTRYKENGILKLRLVEMSADGVILKDTKKELKKVQEKKESELIDKQTKLLEQGKNKEASELKAEEFELFPNSKYPYFLTPDMYRENTVWAKASAELVLPISDQIDELDDSILRNARLTGNPIPIIETSSGIDAEKVTNTPGQTIVANNINGMKWLQPPNIPQYLIEKRADTINNDKTIVTRFSDQMIGKQQAGVGTATESLALQNSGNSMIEHKKGLLQETLSEVFEYAIELALLNWNTTMIFRITGEDGQDKFTSFNPENLNRIPVLTEADTEYRNAYREAHKDAKPEDYEYMQVYNETRKVMFDLSVSVGAGLPNNRAYRYSLVRQAYVDKAISTPEYRNYLIKQVGLNIPEIPETLQEQQQIGVFDQETLEKAQQEQALQQQTMNAGVEGLNANGNVQTSYLREI